MKILKNATITFLALTSLSTFANTQNVLIDGDHGKLAAVIQTPDNKTQYPMVIICHGFTSDKEFVLLEDISNRLEKNGIASVRFDFNGHGKSEGKFEDMTVVNEITDAKKVYEYVKAMPEVSSVSIAGHSQGGVVASMVAGELGKDKIKSVVLLAPAAVLRDYAIRGQIFDIKYDALNPPKYVELHDEYHEGMKIGHDYITTAQNLPIFETAKNYKGPTCMIHGTADTIVPYTYSQRYLETFANGELNMLEGADHAFTKHMEETAKIASDFFVKVLNK